ncbi:hypothetical protein LTR70_009575 [Exophiala xenobiotica]|uniref:Uncharacterized protein n=1 Tax=Lithohypha guttulata TaxID=1690604 RepID=A0ABR0JXV8_9EURO|nr:hypothetical protein LTR24_009135 [Lithohypha guttulata]KAK5310309.1 hypothetical protein LTR70_009575 [Exophiala xenobiotica]
MCVGDDKIDDLEPLQDNDTGWSPHFTQVQHALLISQRIDFFCYQYKKDLKADTLAEEEWEELSEIELALQPFTAATTELQSNATRQPGKSTAQITQLQSVGRTAGKSFGNGGSRQMMPYRLCDCDSARSSPSEGIL